MCFKETTAFHILRMLIKAQTAEESKKKARVLRSSLFYTQIVKGL